MHVSLTFIIVYAVVVISGLLLLVTYYSYFERRLLAFMQSRIGPNRVGPYGLLQPIADVIKLLTKEVIIPLRAEKKLYILAPLLLLVPSLTVWFVMPVAAQVVLANINVGLLVVLALSSCGIYGILLAGWSTNSSYALLGMLRAGAQIISYEISMTFALIGVLLLSESLNLTEIVVQQQGGAWHWFCWPLLPLMVIYWITAVAETNRAPFDVAEGESEIVAGFHVEYSGVLFALFFLAEYANMILVSALTTILFFGGWHSPFSGIMFLEGLFKWIPGVIWFFSKTLVFMWLFIWLRATLPRFRYDQIMRLNWQVFVPITFLWLVLLCIALRLF